jgi:hypothetical protein
MQGLQRDRRKTILYYPLAKVEGRLIILGRLHWNDNQNKKSRLPGISIDGKGTKSSLYSPFTKGNKRTVEEQRF